MKSPTAQWQTGVGLALIHLGALAAFVPALFSWWSVATMVVLWYVTGGFGVTLGFHRILTHRSLVVPKPLEYLMATLGTLALQGGPIEWVATHRAHHANTDREGDPHNVHRGLAWAHVEWLYRPNRARLDAAARDRLAPDLVSDPFYRFLERFHVPLQVLLGIALFAAGGLSLVVWGIFARLVTVYHITWLVNSAAHYTGYRTYRTGDQSTNCWWVALLTWGEGWHNNHHAFPFSARHGLRWFEFDVTWLLVKALAALKLARDIKLPTAAMRERLEIRRRPFSQAS